MKLHDFLKRIPQSFALELLEALPGPDRRELLRAHNARVKAGPGNLKRASRGRTLVIITHRLSALSVADRVVYLERGRVERIGAAATGVRCESLVLE